MAKSIDETIAGAAEMVTGVVNGIAKQPADLSFSELIRLLRDNDAESNELACRELEKRYYRQIQVVIRGFMRTNVKLKKLAETDVYWDSVIMALRDRNIDLDREVTHPGQSPLALLRTIVKRKMITQGHSLETVGRGGNSQQVPFNDNFPSQELTASKIVSTKELIKLLEDKRAELNDIEREILRLRLDGVPWKEIAKQVNNTVPGAQMRMQRALEKLREMVHEDEQQ